MFGTIILITAAAALGLWLFATMMASPVGRWTLGMLACLLLIGAGLGIIH
jgi:hypothetical protein